MTVRVHRVDRSRGVVYVYGWRDVIAWPITAQLWEAFGGGASIMCQSPLDSEQKFSTGRD